MPDPMSKAKEKANKITALSVSISEVTNALVEIRKRIPEFSSDPSFGALAMRREELELELLWLDNEFNALLAGGGTIAAPTNEQLEAVVSLAREVDEAIRQANTASAVLSATNKALELANKVKNG